MRFDKIDFVDNKGLGNNTAVLHGSNGMNGVNELNE